MITDKPQQSKLWMDGLYTEDTHTSVSQYRTMFIKDLFIPNQLLNSFDELQFHSLSGFLDAIQNKVIQFRGQIVSIYIDDYSTITQLLKLCRQTTLDRKIRLQFHITFELFQQIYDACQFQPFDDLNAQFVIHTVKILNLREFPMDYYQHHAIWFYYLISYQNYVEVINHINRQYVTGGFRHFHLEFDYASFQNMPFGELAQLKFWISRLKVWERSSHKVDRITYFKMRQHPFKPIYIDDNLNLYYNSIHFHTDPSHPLLNLKAHLTDDGESLDFVQLNRIRQYQDLSNKSLYMEFKKSVYNLALINYFDNERINGAVNSVPTICNLIMDWRS